MISSVSNKPLEVPILFIIFNRPETTKVVFDAIRHVKPSRLYIAADGPRQHVTEDVDRCEETRRVVSSIDWDCRVFTLFGNKNLGCGKGVCEAINWFFENEEEGIILEDDCLPAPAFFQFCATLLHHYRNDTRIMGIGGNNFEGAKEDEFEYSYRFSTIISIWGWATWRRAWMLNDYPMAHYAKITERKYLKASYDTIYEQDFYHYVFEKMHLGDDTTNSHNIWDFQWQFACKINSGLLLIPTRNLIVNIGLGKDSTNTKNAKSPGHDLSLESLDFPLTHPDFMMVDHTKDSELFNRVFTSPSSRLKSHLKNLLPDPLWQRLVVPMKAMFSW